MSPRISVVMPVYNVEQFVKSAIESVLKQTYDNFELLIVDDRGDDNSMQICKQFIGDPRVHIIRHQTNKGLAAARNTGIRHSLGEFVAFIDSDDLWHPEKLQRHVVHLDKNPNVGLSFSRSSFIDYQGKFIDFYQMPKLFDIDAAHLLCRNPVGNGSAPVIRRSTINDIRFQPASSKNRHSCYFDENFRQSEDIECWLRIAATTSWEIEGLPEPLTYYRLNHGGLSANLEKQYASWEKMIEKARGFAPKLLKQHEESARGFQLRYLSRQAIRIGDGSAAVKLFNRAMKASPSIIRSETFKTVTTMIAAYAQWIIPAWGYIAIEAVGQKFIGILQKLRISRDGVSSEFMQQSKL
ncbi:glucosyl transferase [Shewanella sp. 10N.286.52.C2]|uniref:glycosyltransferase family 2 protein n=1 Tax=Shewanella sp. 10N.286.52.C2 TaxID=1880838 RepID=UPI000C85EA1F|nr:glycosyltransferase family A protein [Shewanella sp. 10N.286.52.C2]PMG29783.1 glucosyl transferase [Shewanella sp. 10N.286.52.C2]